MRREKMFAVLPTMLTLGNALCGFAAITYAAKVGPEEVIGNPLLTASFCVFLGMLFDALDGRAARWANQTSEFGAQLDSLCDAISFGVAPAFLMIQFCVYNNSGYPPRILWVIGALYVACAILRLARFNVETEDDDSHEFFSGLPSPAAAGAVCSFPIAMHGITKLLDKTDANISDNARRIGEFLEPAAVQLLPIVTLALACLMISKIRYSHLFNQLFTGKRNRAHVIQVVFTVAIIFMVREMAVPLLFCYFAFYAPIRSVIHRKTSEEPVVRET
jgi:CDP-diacylglycerol--serine O-phosphatidyltransferase